MAAVNVVSRVANALNVASAVAVMAAGVVDGRRAKAVLKVVLKDAREGQSRAEGRPERSSGGPRRRPALRAVAATSAVNAIAEGRSDAGRQERQERPAGEAPTRRPA